MATDVPCLAEGEMQCEVYPCENALCAHKTEVRKALWLPQESTRAMAVPGVDAAGEGVFAREDIDEGTFVLDFGELREATKRERSGGCRGWSVRMKSVTSLSSVAKTFVVQDTRGRHVRGQMPKGGKVNSTCCQVHKNAELVPDCAARRMYVRTTKDMSLGVSKGGVGVVCVRHGHQKGESIGRRSAI